MGEYVFAKKENGCYYKAKVLNVDVSRRFCVYIEEEDCIRDDVPLDAVVNRNWRWGFYLSVGVLLQFRDEKGNILVGKNMGINTIDTYQVRVLEKKQRKENI